MVARHEQYGRHRGERRPALTRPSVRTPGADTAAAGTPIDDGGRVLMVDEARTAVLRPTGRLNMVAAPAFKNEVEETVAAGRSRIVVDLTDVTFIDSSGLGALIAALKATRQADGDLRIAAAPEQVMTVLRLTNLDRVLPAHDTVADASRDW